MNISDEGLDLIKSLEGLRLNAYKDSVGIWTIGYGTIKYADGTRVKEGDTCFNTQADFWLKNDVQKAVNTINRLQWQTPLNQYQFDAMVSFQYNTGALPSSTLYKKAKINPSDKTIFQYDSENPVDSCEFLRWVRGNGNILKGLVNRRMKEADYYAK